MKVDIINDEIDENMKKMAEMLEYFKKLNINNQQIIADQVKIIDRLTKVRSKAKTQNADMKSITEQLKQLNETILAKNEELIKQFQEFNKSKMGDESMSLEEQMKEAEKLAKKVTADASLEVLKREAEISIKMTENDISVYKEKMPEETIESIQKQIDKLNEAIKAENIEDIRIGTIILNTTRSMLCDVYGKKDDSRLDRAILYAQKTIIRTQDELVKYANYVEQVFEDMVNDKITLLENAIEENDVKGMEELTRELSEARQEMYNEAMKKLKEDASFIVFVLESQFEADDENDKISEDLKNEIRTKMDELREALNTSETEKIQELINKLNEYEKKTSALLEKKEETTLEEARNRAKELISSVTADITTLLIHYGPNKLDKELNDRGLKQIADLEEACKTDNIEDIETKYKTLEATYAEMVSAITSVDIETPKKEMPLDELRSKANEFIECVTTMLTLYDPKVIGKDLYDKALDQAADLEEACKTDDMENIEAKYNALGDTYCAMAVAITNADIKTPKKEEPEEEPKKEEPEEEPKKEMPLDELRSKAKDFANRVVMVLSIYGVNKVGKDLYDKALDQATALDEACKTDDYDSIKAKYEELQDTADEVANAIFDELKDDSFYDPALDKFIREPKKEEDPKKEEPEEDPKKVKKVKKTSDTKTVAEIKEILEDIDYDVNRKNRHSWIRTAILGGLLVICTAALSRCGKKATITCNCKCSVESEIDKGDIDTTPTITIEPTPTTEVVVVDPEVDPTATPTPTPEENDAELVSVTISNVTGDIDVDKVVTDKDGDKVINQDSADIVNGGEIVVKSNIVPGKWVNGIYVVTINGVSTKYCAEKAYYDWLDRKIVDCWDYDSDWVFYPIYKEGYESELEAVYAEIEEHKGTQKTR